MAAKRKPYLTVGELRRALRGLPASAEVWSDTVEGPAEYAAGIVSWERGVPKNWRGVKGVDPRGLCLHIRISACEC